MTKYIGKKVLNLLFFVATLSWFGSTMPMLSGLEQQPLDKLNISSDPCEQTFTDETFLGIPDDCLGVIFQFFAEKNIPKPTLLLKSVCKNFKRVVEEYQCFYGNEKGDKNKDLTFENKPMRVKCWDGCVLCEGKKWFGKKNTETYCKGPKEMWRVFLLDCWPL